MHASGVWALKSRSVPPTTERLNEIHARDQSPRQNACSRPLILQHARLRIDDLQVARRSAAILDGRDVERFLCSFDSAIHNVCFLCKDAQLRQVVLHLLKGGQHSLPVIRHRRVVVSLADLELRPPFSRIEECLRDLRTDGPEATGLCEQVAYARRL